ncbi:2-isopropylmalate synthase [Isoalcanivorax beigongshangi]|uniref:2-isopropylmalate synthase n=1 Tax=Isoalcanivorax beigongshangi TaxID=3238810 RepID=A0ABV4AMK1_9GAMM
MAYDHRKYVPFTPIHRPQRRWPDQVITESPRWCAVDLRDGNQALVKPMTVAQKTVLFQLLVDVGFKEIEVGFPAASQPDYDFVRKLIEENLVPDDVTIQVLTQAREELIARSFEALKGARKANVHLYNSTSRVQREKVFRLDVDGIKAIAVAGAEALVRHAQANPATEWVFQYSPESFTGTELEVAAEVTNAVIDVWQPQNGQEVVINLPATVEMSTPNVFADMVEWMGEHLHHREHLCISVHTHNDRGCGVAAAELAVMGGADRVEGTLMGNGERTGNMDIVTMAMNLYSQGVDPLLDLSDVKRIAETVESVTEISTHPRHPYVGELVFTAFSGSHQDAIRKCLSTYSEGDKWEIAYLPIDPRDLGRRYEEVVRINSQSGKGGVLYVLERDFGITLPRWLQIEFSRVVQGFAENEEREVQTDEIHGLFERHFLSVPADWEMLGYELNREGEAVDVRIRVGNASDSEVIEGRGRGGVEALVAALSQRTGVAMSVEAYDEFALNEGSDARALACVRMRVGDEVTSAASLADDTTSATLQSVLSAVGRVTAATQAQFKAG